MNAVTHNFDKRLHHALMPLKDWYKDKIRVFVQKVNDRIQREKSRHPSTVLDSKKVLMHVEDVIDETDFAPETVRAIVLCSTSHEAVVSFFSKVELEVTHDMWVALASECLKTDVLKQFSIEHRL